MMIVAAVVCFVLAAIDVGTSNDWSLPWLVPLGLALWAAASIVGGRAATWPR